ncbi:MAG: NAD(P)/FAD-dependent oxidoreductase, partial [Pseudolysinimonas sp.]
ALRAGKITAVAEVTGFDKDAVLLGDGTRITPDAVVVATGFQRGLEPLVGHLGVLGAKGRPTVNAAAQLPEHPGLYFIGYSNPLTGNLRQLGIDATRIARAAAKS